MCQNSALFSTGFLDSEVCFYDFVSIPANKNSSLLLSWKSVFMSLCCYGNVFMSCSFLDKQANSTYPDIRLQYFETLVWGGWAADGWDEAGAG